MSRVIIATLIRVKVEEVNADVVKTEKKKPRIKSAAWISDWIAAISWYKLKNEKLPLIKKDGLPKWR